MVMHQESCVVALPPDQVFDLVADVERYPEFLPSWQQATVCRRDNEGYDTDQTVGLGMLTHRFHTHTTLQRPHRIAVTSQDDLFQHFDILWEFTPAPGGGCRIAFTLDFDVESWLLAPTVDVLITPTVCSMVSAFEQRARRMVAALPA